MVFGKNRDKGIRLNELDPEVVSLDMVAREDLLVHREDAPEPSLAYLLSRMRQPNFPEPIGVFRCIDKPVYEQAVLGQVQAAIERSGKGDLKKLYQSADTWEVLPEVETIYKGRSGGEKAPSEFDEEYTGVAFYGEGTSSPTIGHSILTDTVAALTPRKPLTAHVDISLAEAVGKLKELNVGFLALVDDEGKLAGVFTEGDIFKKVACKVEDMSREKVRDYMTADVTTVKSNTTIAYALHLMSIHHFRHLPIVDDQGKPQGVISFRSVVHYIEQNFTNGKKQ
jgi:CBS domain-containing protein